MNDTLYKHILVPTNFQSKCQAAYRVALATALSSRAKVTFLHVLPPKAEDEYQGLDAIRLMYRAADRRKGNWVLPPEEEAREHTLILERLRQEVPTGWANEVEVLLEVRRGDVASMVAQYAHEAEVDLIVTADKRPGLLPNLTGRLADRLARLTKAKLICVTPPEGENVVRYAATTPALAGH